MSDAPMHYAPVGHTLSACGLSRIPLYQTDNPADVNCKRCLETSAYQKAISTDAVLATVVSDTEYTLEWQHTTAGRVRRIAGLHKDEVIDLFSFLMERNIKEVKVTRNE